MEEIKQNSISIEQILKIIYKNIVLILSTTIIIGLLSGFYAFNNKSYKSEITLYGNDRLLNEIGENSQYSLNSFEFFSYIKNNSKTLENINLPEEKYLKEISKRLSAQSENNNPTIIVKFNTKSKVEGENFSKEYPLLAQNYLLTKKNNFLNSQIKLLEEQYNFLSANTDLRTTKDSLSDSLVSRLAYYKLLKNDTTPPVKLISLSIKPAINKKMILAIGLFLGLFLGILIAFIKEFSKTLNWDKIK